jgi:hypothetical protein
MPNATDYYKRQFSKDMAAFRGFYARSGEPRHGVVVSVVDLIPFLPGGKNSESVQKRPLPHLMCLCIFFVTLLDQAFHATIGESHDAFFESVRHPKLNGFLGSAFTNVHPVLALCAATLYIQRAEIADSDLDFEELANVFRDDYQRVLADHDRPKATQQGPDLDHGRETAVVAEITRALTKGAYPTDLKAFLPSGTTEKVDITVVDRWAGHFRTVLAGDT